ncbi:hypothetical protein KDL01_25260 [Actinospica durhamensis]|uniref:Uncharacterized protein n=1 Tax=Actinospica durhamensis TaxID=1508375 RepID=A0A941EUC2_9ACTN|nr:hypothetical protein [Actinospica durhamensis]MBR7836613.1 hypothetical protein [Actinospica durhamensis]
MLLEGTTVTARQGDHVAPGQTAADAPLWGLNVPTSTFVRMNGGRYSCDATGAPTNWDGKGSVPVGRADPRRKRMAHSRQD